MEFKSQYVSKIPDANGYIEYNDEENAVWKILFQRQQQLMPGRACDEFRHGVDALNYSSAAIPQIPDVNKNMSAATNWQVSPVAALIPPREFFELLAQRRFPAATFIRTMEELEYVKEPDIFHELFGHCPMLVEPVYADFVQRYAEKVLTQPEQDWPLLQRFFWFTVEFGLTQSSDGIRAYGGGILSSPNETVYSIESDTPQRRPFDPIDILRTPYRIDMLQTVYYVVDSYQQLYDFVETDLGAALQQARNLGEFPPTFPVDPDNPCIHVNAC